MSFPLYDIFHGQAKQLENNLTDNDLKKMVEDIKTLDQDGMNNLYLIIRYAAKLEQDEKVYNAKFTRKGVLFNLESMPESIQKTIYLFVKKHIQETQSSNLSVDIVFE